MHTYRLLNGLAAAALLAWLPAQAATFSLDRLTVTRNGSVILIDEFDDGFAPPSGPLFFGSSYPAYLRTVGDMGGAEYDGALHLNPAARGVETVNPYTGLTDGVRFEAAYLNFNTQSTPDTAHRGLKLNHTYSMNGVFSLTLPAGQNQSSEAYGLRLSDFASFGGNADDVIDLFAYRRAGGGLGAGFYHRNYAAGTVEVINRIALNPGQADQLEFMLSKPTVDDPTIEASVRFINNGVADNQWTSLGTTTAYHGEIVTVPAFFAVSPVPEPASMALLLAGAGLLGWRARRQKGH